MDHPKTTHILIVEDAPAIAQALQRALSLYRNGDYKVETCESGEDALKRLHEAPFDLLITDLRLQGIDGLELIERVRHFKPEMRTLLITAYGSPEIEARARLLASPYLSKPFGLRDLMRQVDLIMSQPPELPTPKIEMPSEELRVRALEKKKSIHLMVIAFDLDGTLTQDGQVTAQTWDLLRSARLAGMILILVTGRTLDSFISELPFSELCEAIVAENGAVVYFPRRDTIRLPFGKIESALINRLHDLNVPLEHGVAIVATQEPHERNVFKALQEIHASAVIEYNRGSIMLLPPGASKGQGLLYALQELGYSAHNLLVCGDGENDRSLVQAAEFSVAVANAHPSLRAVADLVLSKPDGEGFNDLLEDILGGKKFEHRPHPDESLLLGHRVSGAPVSLDPFILVEDNIGIFGSSGSGKSWMAGLLIEEMLKQKYQVCVIDPEGDYRGLGISPNTLLLGGQDKSLPDVEDLIGMLEWKDVSLLLDLSMYSAEKRNEFVADFMRALKGLRLRRGRPHFVVVDEVQMFCPVDGGRVTDLIRETIQWGGFAVVSYRLSQISPILLDGLHHYLLTRLRLPEELVALQSRLASACDSSIQEQLRVLPKGYAFLCLGSERRSQPRDTGMIKFRVGPRAIPHVRHLYKYLHTSLPDWKKFYFHTPDGRYLNKAAGNLWEFREILGEISIDSVVYHMRRGDFEHWLREALHDEELSRQVHKIGDRELEGEALRQALLGAVIARYNELAAFA